MKIINVKDIEAKEIVADPLFSGGKVHTQFVLEEDHGASKIQIVNVNFAPGARNKLHLHSTEQILIVTEGKGNSSYKRSGAHSHARHGHFRSSGGSSRPNTRSAVL